LGAAEGLAGGEQLGLVAAELGGLEGVHLGEGGLELAHGELAVALALAKASAEVLVLSDEGREVLLRRRGVGGTPGARGKTL
jgi:hypothetical protein